MSEHLSTILDEALARLKAGEPVDAILSDYESQRDELAPLLNAALGFSSQRSAPPADAGDGLAAFLDKAATDLEAGARHPRKRWLLGRLGALRELWWNPQVRMVVGTLAALALLFALLASTFAIAADSLPGDWLYPAKLVSEQVRLAFVSSPQARVEHHLLRVRTRVREIERMAQKNRSISEATLARLHESLDASLLAAASARITDIPRLLTVIQQTVEEQVKLLETAEAMTGDASTREALGQARLNLGRVWAVVQAGKTDVQTFRLNAQLGSFFVEWPDPLQPVETREPTPSPGG